jgi:hypothetical protein
MSSVLRHVVSLSAFTQAHETCENTVCFRGKREVAVRGQAGLREESLLFLALLLHWGQLHRARRRGDRRPARRDCGIQRLCQRGAELVRFHSCLELVNAREHRQTQRCQETVFKVWQKSLQLWMKTQRPKPKSKRTRVDFLSVVRASKTGFSYFTKEVLLEVRAAAAMTVRLLSSVTGDPIGLLDSKVTWFQRKLKTRITKRTLPLESTAAHGPGSSRV